MADEPGDVVDGDAAPHPALVGLVIEDGSAVAGTTAWKVLANGFLGS